MYWEQVHLFRGRKIYGFEGSQIIPAFPSVEGGLRALGMKLRMWAEFWILFLKGRIVTQFCWRLGGGLRLSATWNLCINSAFSLERRKLRKTLILLALKTELLQVAHTVTTQSERVKKQITMCKYAAVGTHKHIL
jgi:hypothetical protein